MARRNLACGAVLAVLSIACSGESRFVIAPADAGVPDARYEQACAAWADSVCAYEEHCPEYISWTSLEQCHERSTLLCEVVAQDPSVAFDADRLSKCLYPETCDPSLTYLPLDCLAPGRTPGGGTCVVNEACQSGACEGVCGHCAPIPCAPGCPGGTSCTAFGADGGPECYPIRENGAACSFASDCQSFNCETEGDLEKLVCAPLPQPGEPCGNDCQPLSGYEEVACVGGGLPCAAPGDYCDSDERCSPVVVFQPGDDCSAPDVISTCAGFGTCYGVCLPPASDGFPCDPTQGVDCLPPAQCIDSFCVFPSISMCAVEGGLPP